MIADQKIGKSFMGALAYNLKKLNHKDSSKRAELLETNFASLDFELIKKEIEVIRRKRPSLGNYVYHTSLNFLHEETDKLDNTKLLSIAGDYLQRMGFTDNQYMIFRHYDAEHPHIHLLVNRITFDGKVVSDSNNYKRSEALLRKLEKVHELKTVQQSKFVAVQASTQNVKVFPTGSKFRRSPKKDEIEMVVRTGQASNKMLVQEKLSLILNQPKRSMQDFIQHCEAEGIDLLFNQATTGYVSGITFFYKDFKAKGQALGGRFKWMEIEKKLDYEQNRDRKIVSEANGRTKARYGDHTPAGNGNPGNGRRNDITTPVPDAEKLIELSQSDSANNEKAGYDNAKDGETGINGNKTSGLPETASANTVSDYSIGADWHDTGNGIQISDDEDDALKRRKKRSNGR
ncbi:relaxase/mobilization nuclease domain-containing protein [Mucilaginibacter flavus]|uniref:relaxase/mobilization nuclease domain-containing protein n=1 Tax=Mucilaginibacter flavus TaxID=931504 RepID=UPI0025B5FA20|nr:relaxase/mobilization nuclease domain-containing protein [Mucilaginibacter flavus]MDN3585007.1 relaxase/mobilization nuclease domain-containing protein [Mucilaginibacter flavus]